MKLFNDKKGAELSINVIIIVILAILVLVIVGFFFINQFSEGSGTLSNIFGSNVPDDKDLAIRTCESNCNIAQNLASESSKRSSPYCSKTWNFDLDNDGRLDADGDELRDFNCWDFPISTSCPDVQALCPDF